MKNFLSFLLFFSCLFIKPSFAQQDIPRENLKKKLMHDHLQFNSSQGREFWIAFPPNEIPQHTPKFLEVYVASAKNTTVRMECPPMGIDLRKPVKSMQITTFSTFTGEIAWAYEVRESEVVTDLGFKFSADQPLSIYVINSKQVSSDGFMAIPVTSFGKEYIHCSYYDFNEFRQWASGFLIVTPYENTDIRIQLRGIGKEYATTAKGRRLGDVWNVSMGTGQTYVVLGDGKTRGVFDMSGTLIKANKPFGLISFHQRCMIPALVVTSGRDHISEMMPPVQAWGKKYATVEYSRGTNKGDFFRIIGSEPNTRYHIKWYDKVDGRLIGQREGNLKNPGEFAEFLETPATMPHPLQSIRGTSTFEADKPVLVIQYDYSANWDNAGGNYDPFMILVVPVEQYTPATIFQTPSNMAFNENYFNIIAVGDTTDEVRHLDLIKSVELDERPIYLSDPRFMFNRIPTTDLYWAQMKVTPGAHKIESKTKFGAYIYGFSSYDTYGWPAAMAINKLDETDTLPPQIYIAGGCGLYPVDATELRNGKEGDDPRQIDQGIVEVTLLDDLSNNFLPPRILQPNPFRPHPPVYEMKFEIEVKDKYQDGYAVFAVIDLVGNVGLDSIKYYADSLKLKPEIVDFESVRLGKSKEINAILRSHSDADINIKNIHIKNGTNFTLLEPNPANDFIITPNGEIGLKIRYTPTVEKVNPQDGDIDSIIVETNCLRYSWLLKGRGVVPRIRVEDWNAGTIGVNKTKCKTASTGRGLEIYNPGSDTLVISKIYNVAAPFELSDPVEPPLPIFVPPLKFVYLYDICFKPTQTGNYSIDVVFENNGEGPDSISNWRGIAQSPGPFITDFDWERKRVKTIHRANVYVKNSGDAPVNFTGVRLGDQNENNFRIIHDEISPRPQPSVRIFPLTSGQRDTMVVVPVEFEAQSEWQKEIAIYAEFLPEDGLHKDSVFNYLRGFGTEPKIKLTGYEFQPPVLLGKEHPVTGEVIIESTSETADLNVEAIRWTAPQSVIDFEWLDSPPSNITIKTGEPLRLRVKFTPASLDGDIVSGYVLRKNMVEVISDRGPGPVSDLPRSDNAEVIGYTYDEGIIISKIDFGSVLRCDMPEDKFLIENPMATQEIFIEKVELSSGDVSAFEIINYPEIIIPGNMDYVRVRFNPSSLPYRTGKFLAEVKVSYKYSVGGSAFDTTTTVEGTTYQVPVRLSMREMRGLAPGIITINNPPTYPFQDFDVDIKSTSWSDAYVTDFEFEIEYNKKWMKYHNEIRVGEVINNWQVTAEEVLVGAEMAKLVIKGNGPGRIASDGVLVKPVFQLLLSDSSHFTPQFGNIKFNSRDYCVVPSGIPASIHLETCVQELRNILISKTPYSLSEIEPNPAMSGSVAINYGVGLSGHTLLEIINSSGEIVKTISDGFKEAGSYSFAVQTSELSSGIYYIRMKSGQFIDVKKLVIAK